MTEWGVIGVLIALVGFGISVAKPIVSLTKSITTLTVEVSGLRVDMKEQKDEVHASFVKVWTHEDKQNDKIGDHEARLSVLENKVKTE